MYRTTDKKCLYTVNQELTIPYGDVSKKSAFCIIPQPLGKNEMYTSTQSAWKNIHTSTQSAWKNLGLFKKQKFLILPSFY